MKKGIRPGRVLEEKLDLSLINLAANAVSGSWTARDMIAARLLV
jgi:hypothetical protein